MSQYSQYRRHHINLARQGAARELYPSRRAVHHRIDVGIQTRKFISACGSLGKEARQTRKLPRPFHSGARTLRKIGIDHDLHTVDDDTHARRFR